ncbi:hypothetical protein HK102_003725 [Quaeritorhiza haematococci]|nr:hypothetical protein HK102_003725 [Quaeritorhiza haematococci]
MARFPKWDSLDYTPTTIVFRSKTPLSPEEQTALTEYIRSFLNPTSFLELDRIDNYPSQSMETNAQDLTMGVVRPSGVHWRPNVSWWGLSARVCTSVAALDGSSSSESSSSESM